MFQDPLIIYKERTTNEINWLSINSNIHESTVRYFINSDLYLIMFTLPFIYWLVNISLFDKQTMRDPPFSVAIRGSRYAVVLQTHVLTIKPHRETRRGSEQCKYVVCKTNTIFAFTTSNINIHWVSSKDTQYESIYKYK
jgi:hypothetical protein